MNKDLTVGDPAKVLWKFCLPLFGSIIFQQLYNIADSFVAGKFIGENALAAVGNSYEITLIFIAFAFGCNIGCSVIVSQLFGAKKLGDVYKRQQEMIVVCKPEDSMAWYNRLWQNTVDYFRSLDIPVRTLECCSGDLADLKVKSCDVEAWSPRQKKYFEVGSCSTLGDAQARRLGIRVKGKDGSKYFAHTLNNTCVAPPRMLIAFLENNLNEDGSIRIPAPLRPYMGGKEVLVPAK